MVNHIPHCGPATERHQQYPRDIHRGDSPVAVPLMVCVESSSGTHTPGKTPQ